MKSLVTEWANEWGRKMGIYGINTEKFPAGHHDDLDAFRHAFCHAYVMAWGSFTDLNKDVSDWIGMVMEIPEIFGNKSANPCASAMDLYNNGVGQKLAPTSLEMGAAVLRGEHPTEVIARRIADAVKRGDTINSFGDPRMPMHCHAKAKLPGGEYKWRTKGDGKVRWEHASREGQIFSVEKPPKGGNPGAEYGCRCWAEPLPDDEAKT